MEVASSIPASSVPRILTGTLRAQLLVHVTSQAKISQYVEYIYTRKNNKTLPHNNRPKRLLSKLAPISALGIVTLLPADCRDNNNIQLFPNIIQHEYCQEKG